MSLESKIVKHHIDMLRKSTLKVTNQRIILIKLIFSSGNAHYTAEEVFIKAKKQKIKISLATVYNTLNSFRDNGILNVVKTKSDKIYYDTNLKDHHHFYCEESGELKDIKASNVIISRIPKIPKGKKLSSINVTINVDKI